MHTIFSPKTWTQNDGSLFIAQCTRGAVTRTRLSRSKKNNIPYIFVHKFNAIVSKLVHYLEGQVFSLL